MACLASFLVGVGDPHGVVPVPAEGLDVAVVEIDRADPQGPAERDVAFFGVDESDRWEASAFAVDDGES
jgi:hypothetical protein